MDISNFLFLLVIFVTAAGNILVCLAIARERRLQNTTNYFLMSLAVADCLVAVLVMPMGMIAEVLGHFPLPHYACIIFATMDVLCCTSSIWHMSTMSMDRYFTIRFPFRYGRNKTRRIMLLKIIAVWAISTAISSPVFVLGIVDRENVLSNGVCAPNNASFKLYGSVFAFYIPFIIMVTTYALTMRSLRNVLVHKRQYNREKRRKQTFRPLAQIINQYAEIAQNIRRTSTTNHQTATSIILQNNNTNPISTKTAYNMVVTTTSTTTPPSTAAIVSPIDSRAQLFPTNHPETNLIQDSSTSQYGSVSISNGTNLNPEYLHHNNQHLTIGYIKSSGSKKKRQQQQQQQQTLALNAALNRVKNDCDMSTVYEITENSKSTSSSHDVTSLTTNTPKRISLISNDFLSQQKQRTSMTKIVDSEEQEKNRDVTSTLTINVISPLKEDITPTTDIDSPTEKADASYMEVRPPIATVPSPLALSNDTVTLRIPWQYYLSFVEYIVQYYLFLYPYRLRPLAIQSSSSSDDNATHFEPSKFHQSTSTSFFSPISPRNTRTISTQTHFLPPIDLCTLTPLTTLIPHHTHEQTTETQLYNPSKQRRSTFNRSILASSSLFTHFFRHSSAGHLPCQQCSTKSSSSITSSSRPNYRAHLTHKHSSGVFRQFEMDHVLADEHRPRASSSSSGLLRSVHRQDHYWNRSFRRRQHFQSRSAYFLTHPHSASPRRRQPLTSTTNTNSSDSSSVFHRFHPRFLSTISNQYYQQSQQQQQQSTAQRLRDEHIVAANERKALRVLLIIFCVFVALWTPFFICTFISAVCAQCRERISSNIWFSITWLGYSSSMANPFIYTIFSDVFRRAFLNILCCRPSDSSLSRQMSTKYSQPKGALAIQQQYSCKRSQHYEQPGASTPLPYQPPIPHLHEKDATIYINRCASDSFR